MCWRASRPFFDRTIGDIFGFNALQLGLPEHDFLRSSRMPLRLHRHGSGFWGLRSGCVAMMLPVCLRCLDLVLLPHILEFAEHPHQILREVERVADAGRQPDYQRFQPPALGLQKRWGGAPQDGRPSDIR